MILFQIKLTMWCWAIEDWVTDFFLFFFWVEICGIQVDGTQRQLEFWL